MKKSNSDNVSRRSFIRGCAATAALGPAVLGWSQPGTSTTHPGGPAQHILPLDQDWLFGGKFSPAAIDLAFDDSRFTRITLPHTVTPLSWQNWDPASWQDLWIYRRHFSVPPEFKNLRLFLHFDRAMASATPTINGQSLEPHAGGFLPFDREITRLVRDKDNVLAVNVDSRWLNVPPAGSPKGPAAVDYLLPGGIT